jgi:hypothetical protein
LRKHHEKIRMSSWWRICARRRSGIDTSRSLRFWRA